MPSIQRARVGAAALDAGAIVVFAAVGRWNHDKGVLADSGLGVAQTAWPFLVGAAVGWLLVRGWRAPCAWRPTGLVVWASAVVVGMVLRLVSGQGVQFTFVIVAAAVLAAFLMGWRVISGALAKRAGLKK